MFRAILILLALMLPLALVYFLGVWVLVGFFVLAGATLAISTRKGVGIEASQGGRLTGYRTTSMAGF